MICSYGSDHGTNVDLSRWAYRLEAEERLDRDEIAMGLQRVEDQLSEVLSAHIDKADASPDARRALFVAVVKGWFPVGLDIMHALPAGAAASEEALLGALSAWCERHLPEGEGEPLVGAPMEAAPAGEAPGVGTKPRRPPVVKAG
ncbi:MAG: hypothetical protein IT293_04260 [Deltaproteobacteria bacterium]|nr:hypothetical protein [Deltaproteobacteria bacterium]